MRAPYSILRINENYDNATIERTNISSISKAMKEIIDVHAEQHLRETIICDADGVVVRLRFKNGPSSYRTQIMNGEPLYQRLADAVLKPDVDADMTYDEFKARVLNLDSMALMYAKRGNENRADEIINETNELLERYSVFNLRLGEEQRAWEDEYERSRNPQY